MMRPQWVALEIVLALVWSAVALATESSVLFVLDSSGSMPAKPNGRLQGDAQVVVISDGKDNYAGEPFAAGREARKEQVAQAQPPAKPSPAKPKQRVLFEDKFNRDALGELYEVLEPDPNRMTLSDGKLVIVSTNPIKNRVLLEKTFSGDFIATVRMNMQVTKGNAAGLDYWVDLDNRLFFRVNGGEAKKPQEFGGQFGLTKDVDARVPIFWKVVNGERNGIQLGTLQLGKRNLEGYSREPELWYFQLERKGVNYTARLSVDGSQWTTVGTHTFLPKGGRLGFGAASGKNGIENAAEFGAFVVQGGE